MGAIEELAVAVVETAFPFSGVRQRRNTLNKAEFARSLENRCPEYLMDMKEQLDAAIAKTKQPGKSSAKA